MSVADVTNLIVALTALVTAVGTLWHSCRTRQVASAAAAAVASTSDAHQVNGTSST